MRAAMRSLEIVKREGRELYESGWHFELVRREWRWRDLCALVKKGRKEANRVV